VVELCKRVALLQPIGARVTNTMGLRVNQLPLLSVIPSSTAAHKTRCAREAPNTRKKDTIHEWSGAPAGVNIVVAIGT
jgi:hypothetical protein